MDRIRFEQMKTNCDEMDDNSSRIVIAGISGVFPNADDVRQLGKQLMDKKDLVSEEAVKIECSEIPLKIGKLKSVNKFDAAFFRVHYKQADVMDPMGRILLEKSYEAIVDAGINPKELFGTLTGVFVGACWSDSEKIEFHDKSYSEEGFGVCGRSRSMLANRISFWLGTHGPSYTVDTACSSSFYALEHAYKSLRRGDCDYALIGGCNRCLDPVITTQFLRLGVLSLGGKCKCFDEAADGYCRAEAICVILLQRAKNARRIYAEVVHAKTNCDGYKEHGITYPSCTVQRDLLEQLYKECGVDPGDVNYVEAHATATKVGDPVELEMLDSLYCRRRIRKEPLKVGSIKSNMGHSEGASGLCSVAKVILAMETGIIPPNIHFKEPRKDSTALQDGRITVITEPTPWDGGFVGINNFGFGGANAHVLLHSCKKEKIDNGLPSDDIPRLICISGRSEQAINVIIDEIHSHSLDAEFVRLLHEVHSQEIPGHVYRGYTLVKKDSSRVSQNIQYTSGSKRPIWFVFAGMGSQWLTMGKHLMDIPSFSKSIGECQRILERKGVDLIDVITSDRPGIFENVLNSFVGIAAIQIALVDILNVLEIKPDGMIGHSVGELGCAYADGCFNREQTILAAYYRGLASLETDLIHGSMAAIGLGYETLNAEVPSDIDVACHNGPKSCTVSGPTESVNKFVESLQSRGIFARTINVSNIAYHSRYIREAAPKLMTYLKQIIPYPKERSSKWISSSTLKPENWKYSSPEYHTNNLLSTVYFEVASRKIPSNAVVIEISPHGLLQSILKRSLHSDVVNIPLMLKAIDNKKFLLEAFGKAYLSGVNMKLHAIYPNVDFPVSRGTPMIAPLIRWNHEENWHVPSHTNPDDNTVSVKRSFVISLKDEEWRYINGHNIDGRILFPGTGYLFLAWKTVKTTTDCPIVFENVRFHRATNIPKEGSVELIVTLQTASGNFEVVESGSVVVSGHLYVPDDVNCEMSDVSKSKYSVDNGGDHAKDGLPLTDKDFYQRLRILGYYYGGVFKSIVGTNNNGTNGLARWSNNFVAFMDNMLQMRTFSEDSKSLLVITRLRKAVIDPKRHFDISAESTNKEITVEILKNLDLIRSGGIELRGLNLSTIARKKPTSEPVLEKHIFVPDIDIHTNLTFDDVTRISASMVAENLPFAVIKTVEFFNDECATNPRKPLLACPAIAEALADLPLIRADTSLVVTTSEENLSSLTETLTLTLTDRNVKIIRTDHGKLPQFERSVSLIIASDVLGRNRHQTIDVVRTIFDTLTDGGFLLCRENLRRNIQPELSEFVVCFDRELENERILMLRKISSSVAIEQPILFKITTESYSWIPELQKVAKDLERCKHRKLILYSEREPRNGILGFFNALRKEPYKDNVRCFFIMDETAPIFTLEHPLYKSQLIKDLAMNVYKDGKWGSYRHLLLDIDQTVDAHHVYLNTLVTGDLSSLKLLEGPINPYRCSAEIKDELVHVYYAPLNFRDVMLATGKLSSKAMVQNQWDQDCILGLEYAGKTSNGSRYMGLVKNRAISSLIVKDNSLCWEVPDTWSLEEASTVPIVYATAVYALITIANLQQGESILIHCGSGGVGQAAINICLHYGCKIFTTVGTDEKRRFIRKIFPQIPNSRIGNSRDTSFEDMVMAETNGKGVDIVLNSLAEEKLKASVRCLDYGGRFLEIGRYDLVQDNSIGMNFFLKNSIFRCIMLDWFYDTDQESKSKLINKMSELIGEGVVKPLTRTVFDYTDVESAFRYMASGKHIGKVIIKFRQEESNLYYVPEICKFKAVPRYVCHPHRSYVICGGLGGFGLELVDWLILRGARNVVLSSTSGIKSGYQSRMIRIWRSRGVKIVVSSDDITKEDGVERLLKSANELAPVSAIFNLAAIIKDAVFDNQTESTFVITAAPKASATEYLDRLSRSMCPELEQFVVFSSISCGYGNAGQTNYAAANSITERICELRKTNNLPAIAIEWGAVGDVGVLADLADDDPNFVIGGTLRQRISSCLNVMDCLLRQPEAIVSSMIIGQKSPDKEKHVTIVDAIANVLGLKNQKTVSSNSTLAELGMDSMMAVEIKQTLETQFGLFLLPKDIRSLTFHKLNEITATIKDSSSLHKHGLNDEITISGNFDNRDSDYLLRTFPDEVHASLPIVRIRSSTGDDSIDEVPIDKIPTVFILPGIEGNSLIMEPLAANLKAQVLCLQYNFADPKDTLEQLALSLYPHIIKRLIHDLPFYLIGYSFGGAVALELIRMLEKRGYHGYLYLIDSSPEYLKLIAKPMFYDHQTDSDDDLQVKLLLHHLSMIRPRSYNQLKNELYAMKDWNDRLDFVTSLVPDGIFQHSVCYQKASINAKYKRIKSVFAKVNRSSTLLKTPTTLIRPTDVFISSSDDYGLSQMDVKVRANACHQSHENGDRSDDFCKSDDGIVISGIAGVFPDSDDVRQLGENLFNKVDLIPDDVRGWNIDHPDIPRRAGRLRTLNKFDSSFFGVHHKQAHAMDPMCRIMLEKAYEAIVDAGLNPKLLRGTNTGVFIGATINESERIDLYEKTPFAEGFGLTGRNRSLLANRISFWLGTHGPSYTVDTACASSAYALEHAYRLIRDGECDYALVGGCNLCFHPSITLQFARLGMVSPNGQSKCFDESANGFCRGEAVCVMLLQKAKGAHRIYAEIVHAKTNCDGYKNEGITYPEGSIQRRLMRQLYLECGIDPSTVQYVEAHATGTQAGDRTEALTLDSVFCAGRTGPLKIGSIKSNIGHTEGASGICSIAKTILAMETGVIPPNINLRTLRKDVPAFQNGRIVVVTEPTPWSGDGLIAVNNYGFGGANAHILLSSRGKRKINGASPSDEIPRLVCVSGRTVQAVDVILNEVQSRPTIDTELIRLLHEVHRENIPGHIYRGYTLLNKDSSNLAKNVQYFSGTKRPVWLVFNGTGSQWPAMGKQLMDIPAFAESIRRSHAILKSKNIDLIEMITGENLNALNNLQSSFIGINAIQIGLVNILKKLEITADGMLGHSLGELTCSYADGCLTAEQTILACYYRGQTLSETEIIEGAMAAVGLNYEELKKKLPSDIDVACYNAVDNCTISGPKESVNQFADSLEKEGIFVRTVNCNAVPLHSRYIKAIKPKILKYLKQIIVDPKRRSKKWITTSFSESETDQAKTKYCSAEYVTDNLLNSVYFYDACKKIPSNAVVIEIGPHGLLQAILKRSLHKDVLNIPLMLKGLNNTQHLLSALGEIYSASVNFELHNIYPVVPFPVSRGTSMIAPLVRWEHSEDWTVSTYKKQNTVVSIEKSFTVSLQDEQWEYLSGHVIDERILFPASGYLMLVWEVLAQMQDRAYTTVPVVFENVRFERATNIPKEGSVEFFVTLQVASGNFEIVEGGDVVVSGNARALSDVKPESVADVATFVKDVNPNTLLLNSVDIYTELRVRGYGYENLFKSVTKMNINGTVSYAKWSNNFVSFIDGIVQIFVLNKDTRYLHLPIAIKKITINPQKHYNSLKETKSDRNAELPICFNRNLDLIRSGGIEIRGIKSGFVRRKRQDAGLVLEKYIFTVDTDSSRNRTIEEFVRISIGMIVENLPFVKGKAIELVNDDFRDVNDRPALIAPVLHKALANLPMTEFEIQILSNKQYDFLKGIEDDIIVKTGQKLSIVNKMTSDLIIVSGETANTDILQLALKAVKNGRFILYRDTVNRTNLNEEFRGFNLCLDYTLKNERILLFRKESRTNSVDPIVVRIESDSFSWVTAVQNALKQLDTAEKQKLIIYAEKEPFSGILGFFKALKREPNMDNIRCFAIMDSDAPSFNLQHSFYRSQLVKDLSMNVYKNGSWGRYTHLPLELRQTVNAHHAYVSTLIHGDLSSLTWLQGSIDPKAASDDSSTIPKLIHVYYASLNFRDVMLATGKLPADIVTTDCLAQDRVLGLEFAGKASNGKRYMGAVPYNALSTLVINESSLYWEIPDEWSLEEASTVPIAYATVVYGLITTANLRKGESVLIHTGSGAVGQAAINICLYYHCEIFITVGTEEKRKFIRDSFPQIPENHIGNSRDTSFEDMVMSETSGKGVDVVLNSLAEEKLQASTRCLGYGGRFLEIGKFDLVQNNQIGMEFFLKSTSFHCIMLEAIFAADWNTRCKLMETVQKFIRSGVAKPLTRTVYNYNDVESAFRYMASGKHIGKIVLKLREEEEKQNKLDGPRIRTFEATPRYLCRPNGIYVLCGGLGGFGLQLADWLVQRGARNLVLNSRNGIKTGYQSRKVHLWRSYGVRVIISQDDISREDGVKNLLNTAKSIGPVLAIFNLSAVLNDSPFEYQTEASFELTAVPKSTATRHLDRLSRIICSELEQFVIFSSISCGYGAAEQTNYATANSIMERICERRKADKLPALAIQWGAVGDVGILRDATEKNKSMIIGGVSQQKISCCLDTMDYFLTQNQTIVTSMVVPEKRKQKDSSSLTIVDKVSNVLGLKNRKTVGLTSTLAELGMDSMMAVEIKQILERHFETFLNIQNVRNMTFNELNRMAVESGETVLDETTPN